jgi:HK97 family phage major capsid protein
MSEQLEKIATGITNVMEKQSSFEATIKSIQEEIEAKNKDITELKSNVETIDTKMKKSARFGSFENTSDNEDVMDLTKGFDIANKFVECIGADGNIARKEFSNVVSKNYNENKDVLHKHLSKKFNYNFDNFGSKSLTTIDMSSSVDGGMYVPPVEFLPNIEQQYRQNPILSAVSTYVIRGKEAKIPYISRRGNWTALREGESVDSNKNQFKTPAFSFKTVSASKYSTMITMTDEDREVMMMGNGSALMGMIDRHRVETLLNLQSDLITNGDLNEPMKQQGLLTPFVKNQDYIVNKPWDYEINKIGKILTANSAEIIYDDIINLTTRTLLGIFKPNAQLMMNSNTLAMLSTLKDNIGQYHFRPQGTLNGVVVPATINGVQIVINDFMPDIASGLVPVIYGDFRQAIAQVKCFNDIVQPLSKVDGDNAHYKIAYMTYFGSTILDYQSFRYLEVA